MRRASILAVLLAIASCCSLAQDRALISGDAEDKQDIPVPGVRVTLRNESLRIDRTTTTNSDGLYFFAEVAPAEGYVISAEAPGMQFAPQSVKFNVEVGETRHILPSFIVDKLTVPTSSLREWRWPLSPYQAARLDAGVLLETRTQRPMDAAATPAGSGQLTSTLYTVSSTLGRRWSLMFLDGRRLRADTQSIVCLNSAQHEVRK
jgi:hypothetical protein